MHTLNCSDSFWDFSLKVYSTSQVPSSCIELQDSIGLDVNVLLLSLLAVVVKQRQLTTQELSDADRFVQSWRDEVVKPIRALRRRLKPGVEPIPSAISGPLRDDIKKVELDAEYLQQQALAAWLDELPEGQADKFCGQTVVLSTARAVVSFYLQGLAEADRPDRQQLDERADTVARAAIQAIPLLNARTENQ